MANDADVLQGTKRSLEAEISEPWGNATWTTSDAIDLFKCLEIVQDVSEFGTKISGGVPVKSAK